MINNGIKQKPTGTIGVAQNLTITAVMQLRVFYAIALLMVGVLYPEDKTLIAGIHWPPFVVAIGLIIMIALKRNLSDGVYSSCLMTLLISLVFFCSMSFNSMVIDQTFMSGDVLRTYLTLLVTSVVAFLLVSDLPARVILYGIYRLILFYALAFLVFRLVVFDFSREGAFLGLGPLTFARYVSVAWIAQVAYHGGIRLLPTLVFSLSLMIADSKGPILFLIITAVIWLLVYVRLNFMTVLFIVVALGTCFTFTERFENFFFDLTSLARGDLVMPDIAEYELLAEEERFSSTVARLIAISSSVDLIAQRPLTGWGIGSWPSVTGLHSLEYPHNSIIEIWFEYGIMGLTVFLLFVGRAAFGISRGNLFSLFVIFCGLLSLTTGSVRDLRMLCFFTLLAYHFMRKSGPAVLHPVLPK